MTGNINIYLSDIIVPMINNILPLDETIQGYFSLFDENMLYKGSRGNRIIKCIEGILPVLNQTYTDSEVEVLIDGLLTKIKQYSPEFNKTFFATYLLSISNLDGFSGSNVINMEKISLMENLLTIQDINCPAYEVAVSNRLLNLYLNDPGKYYVEISELSTKIKALIILRDEVSAVVEVI